MYCIYILTLLYLSQTLIAIDCNEFIARDLWESKASKEINYQIIPVGYVIINHTAGNTCSTFTECSIILQQIQEYHMNTFKWSDIGYNFMVGNDGNVYEGRGWHKVGAHTKGYNVKALGIAFIGDFNESLPNWKALIALQKLLYCGMERGELDVDFKLLAARQLKATASPGLALYNEIKTWKNWSLKP